MTTPGWWALAVAFAVVVFIVVDYWSMRPRP